MPVRRSVNRSERSARRPYAPHVHRGGRLPAVREVYRLAVGRPDRIVDVLTRLHQDLTGIRAVAIGHKQRITVFVPEIGESACRPATRRGRWRSCPEGPVACRR